jgi:serine/threonine protein kinase
MGEVYRARDPRLQRDVAVKVLRGEAVRSSERRVRFEMEARAASALNHPNILTVHDIGDHEGQPYIVTELVDGETLRGILKNGPLGTRRLLDLASQISSGLAAAHAAGITHRDLKPENIMVTRDGHVKILDFGLAKLTHPAPAEETLTDVARTEPGTVMGTAAYMSPEQARGTEVDFRSDQFSLGLVLHEAATGRPTFRRASHAETMAAILREDPSPLDPSLPAPFRWIIERLLAKDPERDG